MNVSVEKLENSMANLHVELPAESLSKAIDSVYKKTRNRINVPGFRKGKAPRKMIERMYGKEVFYEDAARELVNEEYNKVLEETDEEIVSNPEITIDQIEEGKPFQFSAKVALRPPVGLGKYKGVTVDKVDTDVSDDELDDEIERVRNQNARMVDVTDRAVQIDDIIKLDYEGSVDGVPFDGGKGENQDLTIGSGTFIPGFEDQLVGAKIGETVNVNVTFPEEYHADNLKGKDALFVCKVNEIREKILPELNDEYASDISEFETLEEYKNDVKAKMIESKEAEAKIQKENQAITAIIDDSDMDLPEAMVETMQERIIEEFAQRLRMQGIPLEQYMQMMQMDQAKLMEQVRPEAEIRIKSRLVLEEIAAKENIEVSDEELDEEIKMIASSYGMGADKFRELMSERDIKRTKKDIGVKKAAEFVVENVKEGKAKKKADTETKKTTAKKTTKKDDNDGEEKPKRTRAKKSDAGDDEKKEKKKTTKKSADEE